jgi:hypothetical protein
VIATWPIVVRTIGKNAIRYPKVEDPFYITTDDTLQKIGTFFLTQMCRIMLAISERHVSDYTILKGFIYPFQLLIEISVMGTKITKSRVQNIIRYLPS